VDNALYCIKDEEILPENEYLHAILNEFLALFLCLKNHPL